MIPLTDLSVGPDPDRYFEVDPAVTDSEIPRVISLQGRQKFLHQEIRGQGTRP